MFLPAELKRCFRGFPSRGCKYWGRKGLFCCMIQASGKPQIRSTTAPSSVPPLKHSMIVPTLPACSDLRWFPTLHKASLAFLGGQGKEGVRRVVWNWCSMKESSLGSCDGICPRSILDGQDSPSRFCSSSAWRLTSQRTLATKVTWTCFSKAINWQTLSQYDSDVFCLTTRAQAHEAHLRKQAFAITRVCAISSSVIKVIPEVSSSSEESFASCSCIKRSVLKLSAIAGLHDLGNIFLVIKVLIDLAMKTEERWRERGKEREGKKERKRKRIEREMEMEIPKNTSCKTRGANNNQYENERDRERERERDRDSESETNNSSVLMSGYGFSSIDRFILDNPAKLSLCMIM